MVQQGVIKSGRDRATEWCHPMVAFNTPGGGITICVNLPKLNQYVKRPSHPGWSPNNVVNDIPTNQQFFTTLDAVKGYLYIPLAKESQELTTFTTPWETYNYLRAPMALCSTGDNYNRLMDAAFHGLPNQKKVVDDILAYGIDFKEHVNQIRRLLQWF